MASVYVAMSEAMQEWGADAGISKHLYRVALTDEDPKAAVEAMVADGYAGQKDWQLIGSRDADGIDQATLTTRLAERQKMIDPLYYPKIKGAKDIARVDQRKVEANLVIKRTMDGRDSKVPKLKPKDIAEFIFDGIFGSSSMGVR